MNFLKKLAAGILALGATLLVEHRADIEPQIEAAGVQGVDGLVKLIEKDDAKLGAVAIAFNGVLEVYKPEIEAAIPQFEGPLFDKLVNALKSVAASLGH